LSGPGGPGGIPTSNPNPITGPPTGNLGNPLSSSIGGTKGVPPTSFGGPPFGGPPSGTTVAKSNDGQPGFPMPTFPPTKIGGGPPIGSFSQEPNKFGPPPMGGSVPSGKTNPGKNVDPSELPSEYQPIVNCVLNGLQMLEQIDVKL